jgi:hypothetical protein
MIWPTERKGRVPGILPSQRMEAASRKDAERYGGILYAEFFIKFLTRPGDVVFDPFAGSNTTGAEAESLGRGWVSVEANREYIRGSRGRFVSSGR